MSKQERIRYARKCDDRPEPTGDFDTMTSNSGSDAAQKSGQPTGPTADAGGIDDEVVKFSSIRRRTAEHMVRSKQTSPHALTAVEVDYHNVEKVRRVAKAEFRAREGVALTYLPFIGRAVIDALNEFPQLNASVGANELIVHHKINLGVAVDLDFKGLMVPVLHDVQSRRIADLAGSIADLAQRARTRKLIPEDVQGGTFTITNLGAYGTTITFPVINQPQVAILSTDGVRKRPVVIETPEGDAIDIHPVGWLALAWDHRAVDGAYAAAFLRQVQQILETRDWAPELT